MPTELNAASEATVGPIRESLRAAEKIRSLRYSDAETNPPSSVVPDLATRKGKVLGFNLTTGAPEAVELPTAFSEILLGGDATGDIYYRSSGGDTARLPIGSAGQTLTISGGLPAWVTLSSVTETLTNKTLGSGTKVTLGSDATGDMYYRASGGNLTRIATGTNGHILTLSSGLPVWAAAPTSWSASATETITNKTLGTGTKVTLGSDATGDMYYRASGGELTRVPIGSAGQVLTVTAGLPAWEAAPSGGGGGGSGVTELYRTSTTTDFYHLTDDGLTEDAGNMIVLPNNTLMHFKGALVGYGAGGTRYTAIFEGFISRGAGASYTYLVGTPTITEGGDEDPANWGFVIAADTTLGALVFAAQTDIEENTNWKCAVQTAQVSAPV